MNLIKKLGANEEVRIKKLYEHIPNIEDYFIKVEKKEKYVEISLYLENEQEEIKEIKEKEGV